MPRIQDLVLSNLTIEPTSNTQIGLSISGIAVFNNNLTVSGNTTITGNLSVQGTTTTIQSVTTVYQDPILQIGGTTTPISDDNKDRGISFYYYDNDVAKIGFMGYDNSADGFVFKTTATISSEVVSGTNANIVCGDMNTSGRVIVDDTTDATTTTNGSLQTDGGLSVVKNAVIGVNATVLGITTLGTTTGATVSATGILNVNNATDATTTTDGSLQTDGGLSVAKKVYVGETLTTAGDLIVNGGDITNATASTPVNVFATTTGLLTLGSGDVNIGATTRTTTLKGLLNVDEAVSFDTTLLVSGVTTLGTTTGATLLVTGVTTLGTTTGATVSSAGILNVNNATDATTTTDGSLQTDGGLSVAKKVYVGETITSNGSITANGSITSNSSITANGSLNWFGCKKFQSFAGTLVGVTGDPAIIDNDVLFELGTLNVSVPTGHETATHFFIDKVVIGIKTAANNALTANLHLSSNSAITMSSPIVNGTEIVGADVSSFNPRISATDSITEIDINMAATAGTFHVFEPNITAPITSTYLYLCATSNLSVSVENSRFTVMMEYTVY